MDGRKNNSGTKGNKGGRPKKSDEESLIKLMDKIMPQEEYWGIVAKEVREGEKQNKGVAMRLWASYRHGQPKQSIDLNTKERNLPEWMQERVDKS